MVERLVPAVVLLAAAFFLTQALKLPFGSMARPGAGFYPVVVAVFACLVGIAATAQVAWATRVVGTEAAIDPEARDRRRRVLGTTLALGAFCFAMPWLGYPLVAAVFVTIVLRGLGSRWPVAAAIGVLSAAGSDYLFAGLLDVPLPRGPW